MDFPGRPHADEYAPDFGVYVGLVPSGDLLPILERQLAELHSLLCPLDAAESLRLHAPFAWSIRQVVGHMIDCERVFGYRALRLARQDDTPLSSFDENLFMRHIEFDAWPLPELVDEFALVRRSHVAMFRRLSGEAWQFRGNVNRHAATARAMGYAIAGHAQHHLAIMRKRLNGAPGAGQES